ncbi:MAG: AMP-binding protein [Polyangiaceae bacterium]|nr:AMP-binding protein [Polyangiaceae bacterium]
MIDLRAAADALRESRATDAWLASWLPDSYADPAGFADAARAALGARRGAAFKGRPAEGCDLYHEYIGAHLGTRRRAFVGREGGGWASLTYDVLHARSNALGAAWAAEGVQAGEVLAIVLPPGAEFAVCWLTALRLGLVPAFVPPLGPGFVRTTLARVAPDRIATSLRYGAALGPALPTSAGARTSEPFGSFRYPPGDAAARLVTPFGPDAPIAVDVPAEVLLEGSVRDAAFVYGLGPSDVLAAPGFDPLQHGPSLLMATLVAGATYAEVSPAEFDAEPGLLEGLHVSVLGLRRRSRDTLLARGGLPAGVRTWFRSLTDTIDPDAWDAFWRAQPEPKRPGFGVVSNAASGGAGLFSPPSRQPPTLRVWPAPGLTWALEAIAAEGLASLDDAGTFRIMRGKDADPSFVAAVIGRLGDGYVYAGSLDLGPDAQRYPCADVEAALAQHPGVRHVAAFAAPGRRLNEAKMVLLAFVDPAETNPPPSPAALAAAIVADLGEPLRPDRIEVFALRPRMLKGQVDRAWCRAQYLGGSLSRKARLRPFALLGQLGYLFAD